MRIERRPHAAVELQIGPMIDVIFLLLVFFLVQPQPTREGQLGLRLPGTVVEDEAVPLGDEQRIEIAADGQVLLNDLPVDGPGSRALPGLTGILQRFKAACDADRSPARVTLAPDDAAVQQRIADVLNACAQAGIRDVTFAGTDGADVIDPATP